PPAPTTRAERPSRCASGSAHPCAQGATPAAGPPTGGARPRRGARRAPAEATGRRQRSRGSPCRLCTHSRRPARRPRRRQRAPRHASPAGGHAMNVEQVIFDVAAALRVPVLVLALAALAVVLVESGAFAVEVVRRRRRDTARLERVAHTARSALGEGDVPAA